MLPTISLIVLLLNLCNNINSARILGLFPTHSPSHLVLGRALMKGLATKGHNVTMVSPFPFSKPIPNYRDLVMDDLRNVFKEDDAKEKTTFLNRYGSNPITMIEKVYEMGFKISEASLKDPVMQNLLKSNESFDIVISEIFMNEVFYNFAEHFNAHLIAFNTLSSSEWTNDLVGTPKEYAYVPELFLDYTDHMNFYQRLINTVVTLYNEYVYNFVHMPKQEQLRQKYLPETKSVYEGLERVSLVLLNSHLSLTTPRPSVPCTVEIGGFHVDAPEPLPDDLQKVLDTSEHGVVYFSMGSNVKSKDLSEEVRNSFLRAFAKLNETVFWKWEDANLPGKPSNVIIRKWFPQQDILAHSKVKLFITHGGLLSTTETVARGVPIIGVPVFADQKMNMAKAQSLGYGLRLDLENITEESISWALSEVLQNPKYKLQAKYRSSVLNDRVVKPLDEAIYWIEYVLRHNGAPHLKTARNTLNFFQYHLLDIMAFLGIVFVILVLIIIFIVKKVLVLITNSRKKLKTT